MEDAIADYHVDTVVAEWRAKEVHLQERRIGDPVSLAETIGQPQGVHTNIAAEDAALPRQAQEIRQLSRAAARLQDDGSVGQLLVECSGKKAFAGFGYEAFSRVKVIIVGKGRFLI